MLTAVKIRILYGRYDIDHFGPHPMTMYPASRVASIFPKNFGKEEATLPISSKSFDLPIIQLFG